MAIAMPARAALLSCTANHASLAAGATVLRDASGRMGPDDVVQAPARRFQPLVPDVVLGYDAGAWWLRMALTPRGAAACTRWLQVGPASMQQVDVYVRDGSGWRMLRSGAGYPMDTWALPERKPMFPLTLVPGTTTTVLVRVVGGGAPVAFSPQAWDPVTYRKAERDSELANGMSFGAVWVLMLAGLILGGVYRRPALVYMACGVGFYAAYIFIRGNYALLYLWPELPRLNTWARYVCLGVMLAAVNRYIGEVLKVHRLPAWWGRLFLGVQSVFLLDGLFGIFLGEPALVIAVILLLDQACRILFAAALVSGLRRGIVRSWYPPVLVAVLLVQSLFLYASMLGIVVPKAADGHALATNILGGGIFLLGTLVSQVRKGRRRELHAREALSRQRAGERERLKQTVALRTRDLRRALDARRQLLARISHDLRAPLAGMLDSARLWQSGDTRHDHPRMIERHARQQMDLIDELLEFSRSELADLELEPVPGYLHAFLEDLAEQAAWMCERKGNRLTCHFSDALPAIVVADFRRVRQVLSNVLGNAAKFTRDGCVRFSVAGTGGTGDATAQLRFTVEDDGIGIPEDQRERLTMPFTRGANAGDHDGSGLGLAIVVRLLDLMGSRLHIQPASGGGACLHFTLTLPLADESAMEPFLEDAGQAGIDGHGRVVLVVDDDPQQRDLLCDLLDGHGFDALAAPDGAAALEIMRGREVDLVVTDQGMPGMDGWTLLQRMRAVYPELPVLLYSALPPRRPRGGNDGVDFDEAMLKPAAGGDLLRKVGALAGRLRKADMPG